VHRGLLFRVERVHLNPPKQPAYCHIDRFEVLPFPPWRKVVAAPIRSKSVKVRFGHALENMHPHRYPLWLRRRAHSPACPICAQSVHSTRSPKFKLRHYQHQAPLPPKTKLRSPCKPRAIQRSGRGRTSRNDRRAPSGAAGREEPNCLRNNSGSTSTSRQVRLNFWSTHFPALHAHAVRSRS
jgi:hypothetical protein